MRRLLVISISALLLFGFVSVAGAEQSAQTMSGKVGTDTAVIIDAYNNSGADVQSNSLVILDTSATAGTTLGAYFTTTTSAGSPYVLGVTDQTISSGTSGRVCVRGAHRLLIKTAPTAGDTITSTTTAGFGTTGTSTANKYGYIGIALKALASDDSYAPSGKFSADGTTDVMWWVWVNPVSQ